MINKINTKLGLWIYYDFANSIGFIITSFYFPLYLIQERLAQDYLISIAVIVSTMTLIFTLPVLAEFSDKYNLAVKILKTLTLITICLLCVLNLLILNRFNIYVLTCSYAIFLYFYQASVAFYTCLLNENDSNLNTEKISGLGLASGQFGNAIGLSLVFLYASSVQKFLNLTFRESALVLTGPLFLFFIMPFILFYKSGQSGFAGISNMKMSFKTIKEILRNKSARIFLLSFFFFSDAILTLQVFASVVLEKIGGLDDKAKTTTFLLALLFSVLAGIIVNKVFLFTKNVKNIIIITIFASSITIFAISIVNSETILKVLIILFSFIYGILFSLSRSFYSSLIPVGKKAQYFSIYTLFERLASVLGPGVWAISLWATVGLTDSIRYKVALSSLGVLGLIGAIILFALKNNTVSKDSTTHHRYF